MRQIELNMDKRAVAGFIDFLANEGYWGQTETYWDIEHGAEQVEFIINGHRLSNVSNQHHQVVIDQGYCCAGGRCISIVGLDGITRTPIEYCLYKLGF